MPIPRTSIETVALLFLSTATGAAQQPPASPDSARNQIHSTLRAFYFNLARHDWEALTADILAAKVVAHRPAPDALVITASPTAGESVACSSTSTAQVEQATITLDGDWAEVSVPRCSGTSGGGDEFRLIYFEKRWRLVYIDLFQEPVSAVLIPLPAEPARRSR